MSHASQYPKNHQLTNLSIITEVFTKNSKSKARKSLKKLTKRKKILL